MKSQSINRYRSYCRSLSVLRESVGADPDAPFVLGATAQAYNLTFDLAWKCAKDVLTEYYAMNDFVTGSPRDVLRAAYRADLIRDDQWFAMLKVRNTLAHDYDGVAATHYFSVITETYFLLLAELCDRLASFYAFQ